MNLSVPYVSPPFGLEAGWIDYNGHLNVAYYHVVFDQALDDVLISLGLGPGYASLRKLSTFTVETHTCYLAEVPSEAKVQVITQLLAADRKRLHFFHEMRSFTGGTLHATCEQLSLHVDLVRRRACEFPADIQNKVDEMKLAHRRLPVPERAGRNIALKRPD
ncbi:thioesterase family protein [Methylobrevis pamukkalensis]|uniref:L-carnitine dehydrogenase n=1 Tax=Methylobrevis pamukkalensis TaxID=1439726 RepID=A0A1E3H319_9HYPH|nr:thioesterase family protein [Methylobrevis pamukkalensis]ODN70712.1 L-carnitine dehydrogenase [Methylobrevis pamukkalensis]